MHGNYGLSEGKEENFWLKIDNYKVKYRVLNTLRIFTRTFQTIRWFG